MANDTGIEDLRLLKLQDVIRLTSLSKTSIYDLIAAGNFPRPLQTSPRRVAWRESEVKEWLEALEPAAGDHERG